MKTFRLKFPIHIVLLAYAGIALCAAVFGATLWRCIDRGGFTDFYDSLQYIILFALSVIAPVLFLLFVYRSKYEITDRELIVSYAFLKSSYKVAEISKIVLDKALCRLAVYMGDSYMILRLNEEWSLEFIDLLLSRNKSILYDETEDFSPGEKKNDDENKGKDK